MWHRTARVSAIHLIVVIVLSWASSPARAEQREEVRGLKIIPGQALASDGPCGTAQTTRGIKLVAATPVKNIGMRVTFATGSATLTGDGTRMLEPLIEALRSEQLAEYCFRIEGHTDAVGSESSNQTLSERRAVAVVDHLVAHGVDRRQLVAAGFGEGSPIAPNDTAAGRERNRRVQVANLGAKPVVLRSSGPAVEMLDSPELTPEALARSLQME